VQRISPLVGDAGVSIEVFTDLVARSGFLPRNHDDRRAIPKAPAL